MTTLSTFKCFQNLPPELRLHVWKFALPGPRVIEVALRGHGNDNSGYGGPHIAASCQPLVLLQICQESRALALEIFKPSLGVLNISRWSTWVMNRESHNNARAATNTQVLLAEHDTVYVEIYFPDVGPLDWDSKGYRIDFSRLKSIAVPIIKDRKVSFDYWREMTIRRIIEPAVRACPELKYLTLVDRGLERVTKKWPLERNNMSVDHSTELIYDDPEDYMIKLESLEEELTLTCQEEMEKKREGWKVPTIKFATLLHSG